MFSSGVSDPSSVVLDEDIEFPAKHEVIRTAQIKNPTILESVLEPIMNFSGRVWSGIGLKNTSQLVSK